MTSVPISPKPKSPLARLAEANDVTVLALEFGYIHKTLVECKKRIEADGSNHTWINPAIDIALARSKGDGLENLLGIKRATDLAADIERGD